MSSTKTKQPTITIITTNYRGVIFVPKVTRRIRLEPKVEDAVQRVAELESRTFSSTCNWLLGQIATKYLSSHKLAIE